MKDYNIMINSKLIINSEFLETQNKSEIFSPENNQVIGTICKASVGEVDDAYKSAREAFVQWSNFSQYSRNECLTRIILKLEENRDEIATLLSKEIAKPIKASYDEVDRSIEYIKFTIAESLALDTSSFHSGSTIGYSTSQKIAFTKNFPYGVVLCISPFNYPVNLAVSKIFPALVSGNVVIFKPATQGSLSAFLLAKCIAEVLPRGVFQYITGNSSEIGDYIVAHSSCDFVNFTGSVKVGKNIASIINSKSNIGVKGLILEMGGKDSAIITENADIDIALDEVVKGSFSFNGQRCTAIKNVFIDKKISGDFISLLKTKILDLKIGEALNEETKITTLIDNSSADYVELLAKDAKENGCQFLFEFQRDRNLIYPNALSIEGGVDNISAIRIFNEEQFGPVLPIYCYTNLNEVIDFVNSSKYGLQNSIFSKNIDECFYIAEKLYCGTVQINGKSDRGPDNFPFSGFKDSGYGTQGVRDSILSMTKKKLTVINNHLQ